MSVFKRLTLCQLEPVIHGISGLNPFIIMRWDESSTQDILEFTSMFPGIPVVLTEVMWGALPNSIRPYAPQEKYTGGQFMAAFIRGR